MREFCKDLDSFALSLRKVADIGYTTVQISGTCQYDPQWLKEQLDKNGLQCVITHIPAQRLQEETRQVCDDHKIFGCRHIGLGYFDFKKVPPEEAYPAFLEQFKPVAKTIRENGLYFMYHNHDAVMSVVGEGNINFDAVLNAAEDAGTQYLLVEQDNCNGEDPFDCLKRSYENLRAMGLQ